MNKHGYIPLLLCILCFLAAGCADNETPSGDTPAAAKVDVDLTVLSNTMVYAEVYNIMVSPDQYAGKVIKGSGLYNYFYYEEIDRLFHYFVISDATGCCPQGLDFVWSGEHIFPDDYPEAGETIEVTGVFIKGDIDGQPYYYLAADDLAVLRDTNEH